MAHGSQDNVFTGRLPGTSQSVTSGGAGSGADARLSAAGQRAAARFNVSNQSLGLGGAATMAPYYAPDMLSADLRGRMPAQVGNAVHDQDPVQYCINCGLHPLTEQDADNIRAFPGLATDALARSVKAKSQALASTSRHAAVTVHASLENTAPYKKLPNGKIVQPKASLMAAL